MASIFILALSGCEKFLQENDPPPIKYPESYEAEISFGEFLGRADIICESAECFSLEFTAPETVAGFKASLEAGVCRYDIFGVATEHKEGETPSDDAATLIFSCVKALTKGEYTSLRLFENGWVYEGSAAGKMFIAKQNAETGRLTQIEFPQVNLVVLLQTI